MLPGQRDKYYPDSGTPIIRTAGTPDHSLREIRTDVSETAGYMLGGQRATLAGQRDTLAGRRKAARHVSWTLVSVPARGIKELTHGGIEIGRR